jgi:predicted nuclease of predicted toxin-antitoxin system
MRFLLNMNVPRELGRRLIDEGHDCRHVGDIGMAQASDLAITENARANGEVILTHDLDYGYLLAFSGESVPSVVIFRLHDTHPDNLLTRLMSTWHEIEAPLLEGAIVVMEDAAVRIRRLPITQGAK